MSTEDPTRIVDPTSDASPRLRELFDAGREELPAPEQLSSLAARLGPLLGPGGGGPAGGGGGGGGGGGVVAAKVGAGLGGAAKVGIAIAALAAAGTLVWTVVPHADDAHRATTDSPAAAPASPLPPVRAPTAPAAPEAAALATPPTATSPESLRVPIRSAPTRGVQPAVARTPVVVPGAVLPPDPATEMSLLDRAQRAVRSDPARALTLADEHARGYPTGTLAQEREVIAIDALVRLGRRDEAVARAARFHASFPGSSHGRRIDVLIAAPP